MEEGMAFELLAASLRASSGDLGTFVRVLADKLEGALPGRVTVERKPVRLLSKHKRVTRIELDLGEHRYRLLTRGAAVEPSRATAVRGIVLKNEPLALDAWIKALSRDLAAEAQRSDASRLALMRLLGD